MKTLTVEEVGEVWLNSPIFRPFRKLKDPNDWGDRETIGVNLKLLGVGFHGLKEESFGKFLGKHSIGYVVGIKSWSGNIISGEVFDTLEELKFRWEID